MKPERVFRIGSVSASVFKNQIETSSGTRDLRSVNIQRRFRDGDEWKSSSSFGLGEIPQALKVLELALTFVANKEAVVTN